MAEKNVDALQLSVAQSPGCKDVATCCNNVAPDEAATIMADTKLSAIESQIIVIAKCISRFSMFLLQEFCVGYLGNLIVNWKPLDPTHQQFEKHKWKSPIFRTCAKQLDVMITASVIQSIVKLIVQVLCLTKAKFVKWHTLILA